jgi:anti-sigma regulatory factor (Ser/Thr protein kinase)
MAPASLHETAGGYRHEALLYSGMAEFRTGTTSFLRRALRAGGPVLVVVSRSKIDVLRQELGAEAKAVSFADMADVGDNPARIIAAWRAFVQANDGASQLWGIGEPIYPERSPTELAECQLHEALLNVAFDAATPFWLLCPYDLEALTADVIDEAHRTHPFVARAETRAETSGEDSGEAAGDDRQACSTFRPVDLAAPFARPLPARPADAARMFFESGVLHYLRTFVTRQAVRAGLGRGSAGAMVMAVNEVATNSIRHGGGQGEVRAWSDGSSLVCEVSDQGHITAPLAGRLPPTLGAGSQGGLWLANQLCDLVQISSSPDGTAVRLYSDL